MVPGVFMPNWLFTDAVAKVGSVWARTTAATTSAAGTTEAAVIAVYTSPLRADSDRHSLTTITGLGPWQHAIVHGEVAADQVCPLGSILYCKLLALKANIGVVLAVVHANNTLVADCCEEGLVLGLRPLTALAKACIHQRQHAYDKQLRAFCIGGCRLQHRDCSAIRVLTSDPSGACAAGGTCRRRSGGSSIVDVQQSCNHGNCTSHSYAVNDPILNKH